MWKSVIKTKYEKAHEIAGKEHEMLDTMVRGKITLRFLGEDLSRGRELMDLQQIEWEPSGWAEGAAGAEI